MKKLLVLILLSASYAGAMQRESGQNSLKRDFENFEDARQHCITLFDLAIGRRINRSISRNRLMQNEEEDACAKVFLLARQKIEKIVAQEQKESEQK